MIPLRVAERVTQHAHVEGECIVSDYSRGSHGYAQIGWTDDGHQFMRLAHRVAWEIEHGPIPLGLTIDHLCRNRPCINVDHLRLLTNVDNARLNGQSQRTHCPAGHAYAEHTYIDPKGHRRCRQCARDLRRIAA